MNEMEKNDEEFNVTLGREASSRSWMSIRRVSKRSSGKGGELGGENTGAGKEQMSWKRA